MSSANLDLDGFQTILTSTTKSAILMKAYFHDGCDLFLLLCSNPQAILTIPATLSSAQCRDHFRATINAVMQKKSDFKMRSTDSLLMLRLYQNYGCNIYDIVRF